LLPQWFLFFHTQNLSTALPLLPQKLSSNK
jgi:hypothetical protein